jgi:Holliday junction DNA helicase RuvB
MIEPDRMVSAHVQADDIQEQAIRPKLLKDYIGQQAIVSQMEIFIQAARKRQEALGPCIDFWSTWTGQNHALSHHCQMKCIAN